MWFSRKKAKPVQVAFDKKPLTIVQATDMHYITRKLTDNGEAFRKTADAADGKVLLYSEELMDALKPENFIGRAPQQVEDFLSEYIDPILNAHQEELGLTAQLSV